MKSANQIVNIQNIIQVSKGLIQYCGTGSWRTNDENGLMLEGLAAEFFQIRFFPFVDYGSEPSKRSVYGEINVVYWIEIFAHADKDSFEAWSKNHLRVSPFQGS